MKRTRILAVLLILALLLGGCGLLEGPGEEPGGELPEQQTEPEQKPESKLDAIPFEDGQLYAAAYLGYQEIGDMDYYAQMYLDSPDLPVYHVSDGDYYLIIPRYAGMSMTLSALDIETSLPTVLAEVPDCGPFIVQCNISDVVEDALIRLERGGDSVEFSPFLSLENGAPVMGERGLDLTKPQAGEN